MKKTLFSLSATLFLFLLVSPLSAQQKVDKMPEYPGGITALYKFMGENMHYPEEAKEAKAEGTILVKFTVEKDGSLSSIRTLNEGEPQRPDFVLEAIRVVKMMPKWIPAEDGGKKVSCEMTLPVKFKLS